MQKYLITTTGVSAGIVWFCGHAQGLIECLKEGVVGVAFF